MRLSIEITPEQHQHLKAAAALKGQSIKSYVLERALPVGEEKAALEKLESFLAPRVESAKQGKVSTLSVNDIFKDEMQKSDITTMPLYDITEDAEEDLREIVRYTFYKWGAQQVERYRASLSKTFHDVGRGHIIKLSFSDEIPEARVVKSDHHYVFYLEHRGKKPIIFAVIHEARDIVALLTSRLNANK